MFTTKAAACLHDIFLGDGTEQESVIGNGRLRHDTLGHAFDDTLLNQVVQPASVAEILITLGSGFRNQSVQFLVRFGSKLEIAFLQETVRHFYQLVRIVIVKVELERETFLQAGVGTEHLLHLVLVAGQDDNHIRVGFREHGEQGVNHLFPEIFRFLFRGNQGVGFVDEKYAAPGFLDGLPDVLFCLTDVFDLVRHVSIVCPLERSPIW